MRESFNIGRNRAQESTNAIERMYITMRHLFIRGFYKPMGVSGETLREALLTLRPEIYGTIAESKVELSGLQYIIERLPEGIEECSFINLTSDEGYSDSHFKPIVPPKRRRNCYRIDEEQMNIEITRGRSEIYDILTHLTFMFIESHKIMQNVVINEAGQTSRDWEKLSGAVLKEGDLNQKEKEIAITHTANILGRTFAEINQVYDRFATKDNPHKFLHLIHNLGKLAIREVIHGDKRVITFSPIVRERLGHHIHGEVWADNIKKTLHEHGLLNRELHIISANMHSVMNTLFSPIALKELLEEKSNFEVYEQLSNAKNEELRQTVIKKAKEEGMIELYDTSGTNIDVQIFDLAKLSHYKGDSNLNGKEDAPVIIVMDYAFGEQAYETMDELLKPFKEEDKISMNVDSISIMGKAGILEGGKGDLMIPDAHLFEGTADNYPFYNELKKSDFEDQGLRVFDGSMVTVLGTSLQNRDLLKFFHDSTWNVIGLEMEGAHYQKAIQAAARLRGNISPEVKLRYAYYASDNPLETGSTLASGGLGTAGVRPTYLITEKILEQIFSDAIQNLNS
ncbi:hypothetical protein LB456_05280 [Psychroflexus sp. CAK57W]|uniref:DUF6909 family protein n=1 Tax=Psychroflexus curvus TaxID=2873595 RepID=UPI001CCBDF9A|nr:hypothetical protein [Psychroflexus curvus]MBZ9628780.1 hypothetical protein [Psychroflexus curvus]MBZ9786864.1 hypothetical protein [Psychroflexus curvus]